MTPMQATLQQQLNNIYFIIPFLIFIISTTAAIAQGLIWLDRPAAKQTKLNNKDA